MWTNFHTHTSYCDGKSSIPEIVQSAVNQNVTALGFSSHAPLPFQRSWCMDSAKLVDYLQEIDDQKSRFNTIELYKGLEVDFIPGKISPEDFQSSLDYTIGSIHFVDAFDNGEDWEIDGPHQQFLDGHEKIFKKDIKAVVNRYFELTREMIQTAPPDIIGHLDKIKIQNVDQKFFLEADSWYRKTVLETLDVIQISGCIVEVNTRGLYQKKSTDTYPSEWVLEEILKRNIPITLSSDAHHPDDLINQFQETAIKLMKIGFKKIRILANGRWMDNPIQELNSRFKN